MIILDLWEKAFFRRCNSRSRLDYNNRFRSKRVPNIQALLYIRQGAMRRMEFPFSDAYIEGLSQP